MLNALVLLFLIFIGVSVYFLIKRKWKKFLYSLLAVVFCFFAIGVTPMDVTTEETATVSNEDPESMSEVEQESSNSEPVSSDSVSEPSDINEQESSDSVIETSDINEQETIDENEEKVEYTASEEDVLASLNDFEAFINNYKNLDPTLRSDLWREQIAGEEVIWTGRLIGTLGDSLILRADGPYIDGVGWFDLEEGDRYEIYIADFGQDIDEYFYHLGRKITVKGDLESRGDPQLDYNWKLYNSSIVE